MKKNWKVILVELIVVFSGVYLAFLLSEHQQSKSSEREQQKILTSIKYELEGFRVFMPSQADFMQGQLDEWNTYQGADSFPNFYSWRFIEPQYDYHIIEYALNMESSEIIDLQLYENLSKIYNIIRRLEHAERRLTKFSDAYRSIPPDLSRQSSEYQMLLWENKLTFYRFRSAAADRVSIKSDLGKVSDDVLTVLNTYFDPAKLEKLEIELIRRYYSNLIVDREADFQEGVAKITNEFPRFSEAEVRKILLEND